MMGGIKETRLREVEVPVFCSNPTTPRFFGLVHFKKNILKQSAQNRIDSVNKGYRPHYTKQNKKSWSVVTRIILTIEGVVTLKKKQI